MTHADLITFNRFVARLPATFGRVPRMLRGLYYGGEIDSMELVALTQLAGSAYINAGKPW